jgi:uncharacterized MAPEG superfamily protein
MTIADYSVFASVILYLLTVAPVKAIGWRSFDNAKPRDPAFYTEGIRKRALGAHLNGIETFPFFAVAVLYAEFRHQPQLEVDALAAAFVAIRFLYVLVYLADWPTVRTLLWNAGFFVNAAIFFLPLFGTRP